MADARRFADLKYGHAGKLTYIPRSDSIPGEPGYLITSRLTSNGMSNVIHHIDGKANLPSSAPYFQQIGTSAELYAPSKSKLPQLTHSHLPKERNLQKRWLLKSHPEALMGGFSGLTGLMTEDIQHYKKLDKMTSTQPLLTIGQITDRTVPSAPSGCSVLAVATGESGELLRLTRIEESQWAWDDDKGCTLCLSVIDPMDQEDELVWASGGLAFSQIKFATSVSSVGSIRWLLVQKETSTTILCPEYDKAPKHSSQSYLSSKDKLSRISANLAVTLNHRETGGNSHSDVAFNAPADDWKPQLCVVDKCGYWTLWNIHAAIRSKTKMRMSLYRCGHISEGALDEIPSVPQYPPERHGVLFVGGQREDGFWDNALAGFESPGGTAVRSPHILLWNSERFEIVDTETNTFLPEVQEFSTAKLKYDRIIDIQLSPVNQNHVFILTTRYIVWVDVLHPPKGAGTTSKPAILLTCPHAATHRTGLRMTTNRSTEAEGANAMVSVYSSNDSQISLHWFTLAPENGIAQWHSQMTFLSQGEKGKGEPFATQELIIQPLKLTGPSQSSGIGSRYLREGVQFYQGTMLGRDLSVRYCMCFASENPGLQVTLPVSRVSWSKSKQNSHWRRKRRHILHGMAGAVVVPDSMTDEAILSLPRKQQDKDAENLEPVTKPTPRPPSGKTVFNVNALVGAIAGLVRGTPSQSGTGLPIELFNAFQGAIQHGRDAGRLPLVTWYGTNPPL